MYPNMIPYFHISKWQNICAMPRKNKTRTKYFRSLTLSHSTLNLFISKTTKLHTFLNWLPHAIFSIDVFSCSGFYEDFKKKLNSTFLSFLPGVQKYKMYLKYTHLIELHTNTRICHTLKMQVLMCILTKDYTQFKHSPNEFQLFCR